eukprot:90805_1
MFTPKFVSKCDVFDCIVNLLNVTFVILLNIDVDENINAKMQTKMISNLVFGLNDVSVIDEAMLNKNVELVQTSFVLHEVHGSNWNQKKISLLSSQPSKWDSPTQKLI